MTRIPTAPLLLGLAGLIPFVWGAVTGLFPPLSDWGQSAFGARYVGPFIQLSYGTVILSFMSGVLWGLAIRAEDGRRSLCLVLSVIPALWAFFMTGHGLASDSINLICGFLAVLLIDFAYNRWDLTPDWWLPLRSFLTIIVVICIGVGTL